MATEIAGVLVQGKAKDVTVLDVRGITLISDYFVIASGRSSTQVKALARRVLENIDTSRKVHVEGQDLGVWVLLDYGDVIVHVFRDAERAFYGLERLWGDAAKVEVRQAEAD
ncbi:MAG: ribosome silencing factor [Firmicutes bacterium]|nr:ribosome silencing factor [Candidatus Fermentithermobacillaceae bacterium]